MRVARAGVRQVLAGLLLAVSATAADTAVTTKAFWLITFDPALQRAVLRTPNGTLVTLAPGDPLAAGGWSLAQVLTDRIVLIRRAPDERAQRLWVYPSRDGRPSRVVRLDPTPGRWTPAPRPLSVNLPVRTQ